MALIRAKLIDKIERTPTIESFRFSVAEPFSFLPGQFVKLIFDEDNLKNTNLNKYLSLSCSPTKDYIQLTKRLSGSDFSNSLRNLKTGDSVYLQGPMGRCVFKENYQKISFLIGGIGITPVISIIEYIVDKKIDTDVVLIYSNRTPEEIAFRKILDDWSFKDNIKVIYTITDTAANEDIYIQGKINQRVVKDYIPDINHRISFLFGPPAMVKAMSGICDNLDVGKDKIKSEVFIGY
jgi:ferredoxin-NADP reductase